MKVVGFITEYNPFHYGHKLHMESSLKATDATHSIAVMSGSFVQRGEPSLIDKWSKAKMAIDNGVDLVIELPFIYSIQSAELFAYGGISILNCLNIVNYLAFGSEIGEVKPLENIALTLNEEPGYYKESLKKHLNSGLSYSASRSLALQEYYHEINFNDGYNYTEIIKKSNNILGIEYIKALKKLNSNIIPISISRKGNDYKDIKITTEYASATGIRNKLQQEGINAIESLIPLESYKIIEEFYSEYKMFNYIDNYNQIFQYLFRVTSPEELLNIMDMENGLENRILDKGVSSSDINSIIESIVTKRYPATRIKRILIHLLNKLDINTIKEIYKNSPPYIRVLGSNNKGLEILSKIKESSEIPIITKFADYKLLNNELINEMLALEIKATDLFFLGLNSNKINTDYLISPYIKK